MQRSVYYVRTGRFFPTAKPDFAAGEIVRNNGVTSEIFAPQFMGDTRGRSLFVGGDIANGFDNRLNAVGDVADYATGYQIQIDTLTYIIKQQSQQKFYTVPFADFLPVMVGSGAFASNLLFNREYSSAEDFEAGNIRQGTANTRQSSAEAALDGVTQNTQFWAKSVSYSLIEANQALVANNWDPIAAKHRARKKNFDLGMQVVAFFGLQTDSRITGLLNNPNVTTNTAVITKAISSMTATEFFTFMGAFIQAYITNVGSTAMPDTFLMPQGDYIACSQLMVQNVIAAGSGTYVGMNILDYMLMSFKRATQNDNFKIKSLYYADAAVNNAMRGLNKNYYALYRQDPESLQMNIPVPYTVTQANSINNFNFQDASYAQYAGATVLRNLELLLFTY